MFAATIIAFALQTILQALSAVVMPRVAGRLIWMVSLIIVVLYEGFLSFGLGKKHNLSSVYEIASDLRLCVGIRIQNFHSLGSPEPDPHKNQSEIFVLFFPDGAFKHVCGC
jgi:hypothetical protein